MRSTCIGRAMEGLSTPYGGPRPMVGGWATAQLSVCLVAGAGTRHWLRYLMDASLRVADIPLPPTVGIGITLQKPMIPPGTRGGFTHPSATFRLSYNTLGC